MRLSILAIPLMLIGCVGETGDTLAREVARSVVDGEVARRFPGINAKPVTDCIIDNASAEELITLASTAATRDAGRAADTVGTVLRRADTLKCIAGNAPSILTSL